MHVVTTIHDLQVTARALLEDAEQERGELPLVGLTPTMGALHRGHGSLIEQMAEDCGVSIVSIFVNPAQFGPGEDFEKYPRAFEADCRLCEETGADIVFAPQAGEIYPAAFETIVKAGPLAQRLEGAIRPGHFDGVLTVVLKLLNITQPDYAYFGEKDYQQLQLVNRMVQDFDLDTEIVACEIVREEDGLALSSRNAYLSEAEREAAPRLYRALSALNAAFRLGEREVKRLRALGAHELEPWTGNGFELEYLEVCDPLSLEPRSEAQAGDRALIAARLGDTRLIDNIEVGEENS
jgi:pantoate--beta-alanine ligase